jgi:hypothetical protein
MSSIFLSAKDINLRRPVLGWLLGLPAEPSMGVRSQNMASTNDASCLVLSLSYLGKPPGCLPHSACMCAQRDPPGVRLWVRAPPPFCCSDTGRGQWVPSQPPSLWGVLAATRSRDRAPTCYHPSLDHPLQSWDVVFPRSALVSALFAVGRKSSHREPGPWRLVDGPWGPGHSRPLRCWVRLQNAQPHRA